MQHHNPIEEQTVFSNKYHFIRFVLMMITIYSLFSFLNCHISYENIDYIDTQYIGKHNPKCYDLKKLKFSIEGNEHPVGSIPLRFMCKDVSFAHFLNSFLLLGLVTVFCLIYDGLTKYFTRNQ